MKAPPVTKRTEVVVRFAVLDAKKCILQSSSMDLVITPTVRANVASIFSDDGPRTSTLVRELGLQKALVKSPDDASVLLFDGYESFRDLRKEAARAVERGARRVSLSLAPGNYRIRGCSVLVDTPSRGARQFVSRATDHPLVDDFHSFDFRLWHDPALDRISPLMRYSFTGSGWNPVLLTTQPDESGDWKDALAVGELPQGKGIWVLCLLELVGRTKTIPAAWRFALKLLKNGEMPSKVCDFDNYPFAASTS